MIAGPSIGFLAIRVVESGAGAAEANAFGVYAAHFIKRLGVLIITCRPRGVGGLIAAVNDAAEAVRGTLLTRGAGSAHTTTTVVTADKVIAIDIFALRGTASAPMAHVARTAFVSTRAAIGVVTLQVFARLTTACGFGTWAHGSTGPAVVAVIVQIRADLWVQAGTVGRRRGRTGAGAIRAGHSIYGTGVITRSAVGKVAGLVDTFVGVGAIGGGGRGTGTSAVSTDLG